MPQFRFSFTTARFERVVPWLMLNRQNLDVLVHPLTVNSYDDRSGYAIWLGKPVALRLNPTSRGYRAEQYRRSAEPGAPPSFEPSRIFDRKGQILAWWSSS